MNQTITLMNPKNRLQTIFQRKHVDLPVYSSVNETGQWVSTVTLHDGTIFTGPPRIRKTQAEIAAANVVLVALGEKCPDVDSVFINTVSRPRLHTLDMDVPTTEDSVPMYVLVDYENINKLEHLHNIHMGPDGLPAYIYKFVGFCNHKATTVEPSHIVYSQGKDAVDHFISVFIGCLIHALKQHQAIILLLSKDHFASHHTNFYRDMENITVKHFASEKRCLQYMEQLKYSKTATVPVYHDEDI